jgi:hypothetical protein
MACLVRIVLVNDLEHLCVKRDDFRFDAGAEGRLRED